jgi:hypothetical protein
MNFYRYSSDLASIVQQAKSLLALNLFRYKFLVDGSDRKEDCTYAKLSKRYFFQEKAQEIKKLVELRDSLDLLIGELNAICIDEECAE